MKRLVYHNEIETDPNAEKIDLYGMSRVGYIPTKGKTLEIYVNSDDPGKLPHFHVRNKDDWGEFHTCVRIDCAEYFKHGSKTDSFNSREKKALQDFMNSYPKKKLFTEGGTRMNNWEYITMLWNDNNSDVEIDEDTIQPDYTLLP